MVAAGRNSNGHFSVIFGFLEFRFQTRWPYKFLAIFRPSTWDESTWTYWVLKGKFLGIANTDVDIKNLETADTEITFYGYEVIFNAIEYAWIFVKKRLLDVFLSAFCLSGFCPEFSKKRYPLSVWQGQDRPVRTFGVLVRRRLMCSDTFQLSW